MIVNLHGFNSAGDNNTAARLKKYFEPAVQVVSPSYTVHNFSRGMAELVERLELLPARPCLFVGSSTGALYAEMLARRFGGAVVAINPVTDPGILEGALGWNTNYRTQLRYEFSREDLDSFADVEHDLSLPRLVLVDTGDPVIDHRLTRIFYQGVAHYLEFAGDSHRFTFFDEGLPEIEELYRRMERGLPNGG